jgi:hypothetical protein
MADIEYPTEVIDLPSKGWFYPEGHPFASGQIELYYMTAKHEDILTSKNLISKGVVIDKLLESLVATKNAKYADLFIGDKNAIFVAARIMGYGKNYECAVTCPNCGSPTDVDVNLEDLEPIEYEFDPAQKGRNEFMFTLPHSGKLVTFRLLTHGDEKRISQELQQMKKFVKNGIDPEVTTRMRHAIISFDGDESREGIKQKIELMPARDARAFREFALSKMPNIDFNIDFTCPECGHEDRVEVPIDHTFFWPKSGI